MTPSRKLSLALVSVLCAVGLIRAVSKEAVRPAKTEAPPAAGPTTFGFAGSASCSARACHGGDRPVTDADAVSLQNEYTQGLLHDKHAQAYAVLLEPRAKTIARNLAARTGQPEVAAENDWRCLACHATPQSAWEQAHDRKAEQATSNWQLGGVSCEACHGPGKTSKPWLEVHTVKAKWRDVLKPDNKLSYGFKNLADYAEQARMCAGCHVGAPPDAANKIPARDCNHDIMASGHPRLNFELTVYRANLPPHWKAKTEDSADIWLKGRIGSAKASLELLVHRAEKAAETSRWPELAEYRCFACHKGLNPEWKNLVNEPGRAIGSYPYDSWYGSLLPALNPKLSDGYLKLRSAMAHPVWDSKPETSKVIEAANALILEHKSWQKTADSKGLLDKIKAANEKLPPVWEDAMQLTLALAALKRDDLAKSPDAVKPLRDLAGALSFPPGYEGPMGFTYPEKLEAAKKAYEAFWKMK